jgi:hypothetical protein
MIFFCERIQRNASLFSLLRHLSPPSVLHCSHCFFFPSLRHEQERLAPPSAATDDVAYASTNFLFTPEQELQLASLLVPNLSAPLSVLRSRTLALLALYRPYMEPKSQMPSPVKLPIFSLCRSLLLYVIFFVSRFSLSVALSILSTMPSSWTDMIHSLAAEPNA